MAASKITEKDHLIWHLLADPDYRVLSDGRIQTRLLGKFPHGIGPWRDTGWISPSRHGQKLYRRIRYKGHDLYQHRIVAAKKFGHLDPHLTVDHADLDGLNNHPSNLSFKTAVNNVRDAKAVYRRMGMSAAEAKANWIRGAGGGRRFRGKEWPAFSSTSK